MNKKRYTHIFTASQTVLLGSHELGDHPVVVISLLSVVQLSRAAAEVGVVVQDELEASLVGRVAVGAVVRLHGDLDQGRVANLRAAVGSTAARHVRPAVGVSSATWAARKFMSWSVQYFFSPFSQMLSAEQYWQLS